jgi:hypothetical protein
MPSVDEMMRTYRELAENYDRQGQAQMRDRFLVLAADAALSAGRSEEADRIRHRLLQANPHHLLKPYASFAEAMRSADVQNYVSALRRSHPYEKAEHLLEEMGQDAGGAKQGPIRPVTSGTGSREMERTSTKEPAERGDELKVFRVLNEEEEPKPSPSRVRPVPPVQPAQTGRTSGASSRPAPGPQPVRPTRPATMPEVFPLQREESPAPRRSAFSEGEERDYGGGGWVAIGLFWLVLIVGILLAVYTFARPFLPFGWLP